MDRGDSRKPRHPAGLRGRDIGMYYRNLAKKRMKEEPNRIHLGPSVSVPPGVLTKVKDCIRQFTKSSEDDKITHEFELHFRHLLKVGFDEFIVESKTTGKELRPSSDLNQRLKAELLEKENSDEFLRRRELRQKLPAMKQYQHILAAIEANQIVLVVGDTGCGKTTQVPQLLLDSYIRKECGSQCHIVCTQPRRISAVSVAERVAYERDERLGKSVGYQIRLEGKMPRECGSILYCTTGILLQKLQTDPLMTALSVVILDEIHERSVETDLLMGWIKKILPYRPDLKVILMSATVSEQDFCDYFDRCHTLYIDGSLFPVEIRYLEDILQETGFVDFACNVQETTKHGRRRSKHGRRDTDCSSLYSNMIEPYLRTIRNKYDTEVIQALRHTDSEGCQNMKFLEHLIFYICAEKPPGAILVFLPGYDKISKLNAVLQSPSLPIGRRLVHNIQVYPLHSMMPTMNQRDVFLPPPKGKRKIILSTTVAETSVTIDDVVYVINTGRTKMTNYDVEANLQTLEETWVTKANSQQRKGRAGRVQPGICYNLYTRAREGLLDEKPIPEILRSKLESVILNLKLLHISNVFDFMKSLISVPNEVTIKNGMTLLKRINALDEKDVLTPLGMHLARLPIDPQMGKMVVMGALFRCLDPITSVAAGLSFKSPFYTPLGQEKKVDRIKRDLSAGTYSDHLLIDNAILKFNESMNEGAEREFCYRNFLSISTLNQLCDMKQQFGALLKTACFTESPDCASKLSNVNSENVPLLRAIIAAGLYPNMAHLRKIRSIRNQVHAIHTMSTPEDKRVNFHPSSVNSGQASFDSHYFVYFQKQKSTAVYLMDSTMVYPMALIIFGDDVATGYTNDKNFYISVGKSYYFRCNEETAKVMLDLRQRLECLMQKKALKPSSIVPNSCEEYLIKAIQILLSMDDVYDYGDCSTSDGD